MRRRTASGPVCSRSAPIAVAAALAAAAIAVATAATGAPPASGGDEPPGAEPQSPLAGRTIAIDPGHNGRNYAYSRRINKRVPAGGFKKACDTTGTATDDGKLTESAFNWDLARRLRRLLERMGATVVLTRENDRGVGPCIDRRARIGNHAAADVAISLHADGAPPDGRGFHLIRPGLLRGYTEPILGSSKELAEHLRDSLATAGFRPSDYAGRRGIHRRKDMGGLNLSIVPKVLLEAGNMRNPRDAAQLKRRLWRERLAIALSDGLAAFVNR